MHNDVLRRIIARISLDDLATTSSAACRSSPSTGTSRASTPPRCCAGTSTSSSAGCSRDAARPGDLQRLEGPVRDRLGAGMTMEDGLLIYRTAAQAGWDALVAAADDDERAALLSGADVLFALHERRHRRLLPRRGPDRRAARARAARAASSRGRSEGGVYTPFVARARGTAPPAAHAALAAELRRRARSRSAKGARTAGLLTAAVRWPAAALVALGEQTARAELTDALDDLRALADIARGRRGIVRPADHLPELLLHAAPRHARALVDAPSTARSPTSSPARSRRWSSTASTSPRPPPRSRCTATRSATARPRSSSSPAWT